VSVVWCGSWWWFWSGVDGTRSDDCVAMEWLEMGDEMLKISIATQ